MYLHNLEITSSLLIKICMYNGKKFQREKQVYNREICPILILGEGILLHSKK